MEKGGHGRATLLPGSENSGFLQYAYSFGIL